MYPNKRESLGFSRASAKGHPRNNGTWMCITAAPTWVIDGRAPLWGRAAASMAGFWRWLREQAGGSDRQRALGGRRWGCRRSGAYSLDSRREATEPPAPSRQRNRAWIQKVRRQSGTPAPLCRARAQDRRRAHHQREPRQQRLRSIAPDQARPGCIPSRSRLARGDGIKRVAKALGVGNGTVARIKVAMAI